MVAGVGIVVEDWADGGNLCCINKLMLKSIESLKNLSEDSSVFFISILVSVHSARNLLSMVSSRLANWRCKSSWMCSSDTPIRAKAVKGVISRGVLEVLIVVNSSSMIGWGWEVTSTNGGSTALTWVPRWAWRLLNNPSISSFSCCCLALSFLLHLQ